jgi:sigma-54 dependent transcriptional regulator
MVLSIRAKALLFHDPRSVDLLERVERVARSEATVLIIGETGTGKELIARHIHAQSERKGPFIAVNCGAFSESLIDAELFGHETGAFTGATQSRSGWFEAANGGTLFLDEIGDLSPALQVKLLRVLQERQVVRLGSRRPIALDVRLVAATNVDLHKAIAAERFRSDLYYRLSVATVQLPPLCERPGDIIPLSKHFIGIYADKMKTDEAALTPEARAALLAYEWPGNIRELENVIHYALIVCRDRLIRADDLKLVGVLHRSRVASVPADPIDPAAADAECLPISAASAPAGVSAEPELNSLYRRLESLFGDLMKAGDPALFDTVEQTLIRTVFVGSGRNQVQSARILGISRNILRTHLKRFGMIGFDRTPLQQPAPESSAAASVVTVSTAASVAPVASTAAY